MKLTTGKLRGLGQLANAKGLLIMTAIDHRDSLKKMLVEALSREVGYQDMVDFKVDLCRALGPYASAVLLDPIFGAGQAIAGGALPGSTGLLISMEESGYKGNKRARLTELLAGWSVEKAKKLGASAAKLLIYYRPDLKEIAAKQREVVQRVAEDCLRFDLPLLLETVSYAINEKEDAPREFARIKPQVVIETARQLSALPFDVLKTEFPGDLNYEADKEKLLGHCRQLNQAAGRPWVLLSGGHNYEIFRQEVEIACRAGASGFLAGRALWQEAVRIASRAERYHAFETTVVSRLREVTQIANNLGIPWFVKLGAVKGEFPPPGEGWHKAY